MLCVKTKTCRTCGSEKLLNDFYKHKRMLDGYLNKCKECVRKRVKKHRVNNLEKIRLYDRERGNRQSPEYLKKYRENYPNKYKAVNMVNNAIRSGVIVKPSCCEVCGKSNIVGHHDDYLKPLDVRWLCYVCHKQWHVKNGEGLNGIFRRNKRTC